VPSFGPDRWSKWAPLLLALISIGALIFFDLQTTLARNDDWIYAWAVRHSTFAHPRLWPYQSIGLPQVWWGLILTAPAHDPRLLRLSIVPFVILTAYASYRIARMVGADAFWSSVAATALLTSPVFMSVSATFMTDTFFVGVLIAAAWQGLRWIDSGRGWILCTALTAIACMQRPVGVGLTAALTVTLALPPGPNLVGHRQWSKLAVHWLVVAFALAMPGLVGAGSTTNFTSFLPGGELANRVTTLTYLPAMLGLLLLPFGLAFATRHDRAVKMPPATIAKRMAFRTSIALAAVAVAAFVVNPWTFFPGDIWLASGLGGPFLSHGQAHFYPVGVYVSISLLAVGTVVALLVLSRWPYTIGSLGKAGVFLALLAAAEFAPLMLIGTAHPVFDRYFLPVAAPLIPLAAALISGQRGWSGAWALGALAVGLLLWTTGEQHYIEASAAIDHAASLAYAVAPPAEVDAGYEENAVRFEVPYYDSTGRLPPHAGDPRLDPALTGPHDPSVILAWGDATDSRPGVDFGSLAPAKVVLVVRPKPGG